MIKIKRTKEEWEEIVGHTIRFDTYHTLERIIQNDESYEDIIKDLSENREKYNIKPEYSLVKLKTIEQYLSLIGIKYNNYKEKEKENSKSLKINKKSKIEDGGIYGIYIDGELIYIGKTICFRKRFNNHKSDFNNSDKVLYKYMRKEKEQGKIITFQPIIKISELKTSEKITERDLEAMELALITLYKPRCNYEGIIKDYNFVRLVKNIKRRN